MTGNEDRHGSPYGRSIYKNNWDPYGNWWPEERHSGKHKSRRRYLTGRFEYRKTTKMLEFAVLIGVSILAGLYVAAAYA